MSGRVAAVVVSYNVRDLLLECVASLDEARQRGELQTIVVVDNASHDGSAEAVRGRFPDLEVIEASNRGYGAGANLGIAATSEEYVLILNPDTVIPPGTVAVLSALLGNRPDVALAGPRLRYPDGSIQPTIRRFPERLTPLFESTIFAAWWPDNGWSRRFHMRDVAGGLDGAREVDWVVGAAMLVRRAAIVEAGGFDESFLMYSEEVEWCWRLRRHGWAIVYEPSVEIIHHEGASTSQDVPSRQVAFDTSRIRLARRMYGPGTAAVVRAGLLAGYGLQLVREAIKWLLGHRRDLRRQRILLYLGALRTGLRERDGRAP
ncbi:MAG TPA: glycosyltransferase family 2 protein [Thermomicrobiales bacterium]|nr:glycosyltransferase family 2 protein [Thermomicrobiales bacterium]